MDAQHWDDMYRSRDQVSSGNPNPVLVSEATELPPGQALDVGCGEGDDALWLARHGWQVTAIDISPTALRRAADSATDIQERISWARADLNTTPPPPGAFDLVTVQYFPLRRQTGHTTLHHLLDAVAPGGTLLFTTHDRADLTPTEDFNLDDYYQAADIAPLLGPTWNVLINSSRPRTTAAPTGTHHTHDSILRAARLH
ncbi:class I SAM-dependent methyltransferase [Streptomyces shenzhenensis]|uniref:class I SAM-dependent methyltransferase n=1 Tax=Streptomyces shenzhenensis TaxID=943815 RepID=UPI0038193AD2